MSTSWLIPFENPLKRRLGKEFFTRLPRGPGVYLMVGEGGGILYVGKAKSLRTRVRCYARIHPDRDSRKLVRMVHLVREIRWEECESEEAALLRENQLLRKLDPPFNVMNTRPETYYFFGLKREGKAVRLGLTMDPDGFVAKEFELFGAFKGRRSVRDGYGALLRLLWAAFQDGEAEERYFFPARIARRVPVDEFTVQVPATSRVSSRRWHSRLRRFLLGKSPALLSKLIEALLENPAIPAFLYRCIQEDLQTLERFYQFGPRRNRKMIRALGCGEGSLIPQAELDDWIVRYRGIGP